MERGMVLGKQMERGRGGRHGESVPFSSLSPSLPLVSAAQLSISLYIPEKNTTMIDYHMFVH
jgi:hypothetical protein